MTESEAGGENPLALIELTADNLGRDLLATVIDELQKARYSWSELSEVQQNASIERLRQQCRHIITEGLNVLFRGAFPACEATLDSITVKRGLQVKLSIAKGARNWHEVIEAEGLKVLLVIADPDQYMEHMDEVKARAGQGDLFEGAGYNGTNEFRRDETPPPPAKSWADLMEKTDTQTGEILFGGAQDLPPEEQPQPESIQFQCHKLLAAVHVHVPITTAELWSEQECVVAAHWAMEYNKNPDTAPARPFWLPIPDPPQAPQSDAEGEARTDVLDAADEAESREGDFPVTTATSSFGDDDDATDTEEEEEQAHE